MYFLDIIKANSQIATLEKSVGELTADLNKQVTSLKEHEEKNKEFMESVQTFEAMKAAHAEELVKVKAEFETSLMEKVKEFETYKQETDKVIEATKQSVADETVKILAAQGKDVVVDTTIPEMTATQNKSYTVIDRKTKQL